MVVVNVSCSACGKPVRFGDDSCESCGARVTEDQRDALWERIEAFSAEARALRGHVRGARAVTLMLSVLFVLDGVITFYVAREQAAFESSKLVGMRPDAILSTPIEGRQLTVGEYRQVIELEPYLLLGLDIAIAAAMAGLFFLGKRRPLPAIISALALFVAVNAGLFVISPATLIAGFIVKVIAVVVLVQGLRSALAARAIEQSLVRQRP